MRKKKDFNLEQIPLTDPDVCIKVNLLSEETLVLMFIFSKTHAHAYTHTHIHTHTASLDVQKLWFSKIIDSTYV